MKNWKKKNEINDLQFVFGLIKKQALPNKINSETSPRTSPDDIVAIEYFDSVRQCCIDTKAHSY